MNNKLQAKDLINVGIFSAIYLVVLMAVAMLGYIPVFIPLLSVLVPIVGGIPFMLFLTKVKKFGMVWIMAIIMGIVMLILGMGVWVLPIGIVTGLICELILKSGNYASSKKSVLVSGVFSMSIFGNYLPMFIARDSYFETMRSGYGNEYVNALTNYMPEWSWLLLLAACFISGIAGGLLGKAVLKKHFKKAGIA